MPTLAGNKYLSVHFFLHGPRLFHLSTEKVRVRSLKNGHQIGYSRADTINNNIKGERSFPKEEINKILRRSEWNTKNKIHIYARKVHDYMWLHTASMQSIVENKTGLFPCPFHVSTSSRSTLAGAFRSDYVAACSTALRSATEKNELGGYLTVPCLSKMTQHKSTADWLNF